MLSEKELAEQVGNLVFQLWIKAKEVEVLKRQLATLPKEPVVKE